MSDKFEYIELQIIDILGRPKAMTVPCEPVDSLEDLKNDPVMTDGSGIDGSSILGLSSVESSDLRLIPDPSTLVELPYALFKTAAVLCHVREKGAPEGSYYPKDPRGALHTVCKSLLENKTLRVKIEPEFYLLDENGGPFDRVGYADTYPTSPSTDILLEIASAIRSMGMRPKVIHHEVGRSQQEIEINFDEVKAMADYVVRFKQLVRAITQDYGVGATFMPKPFANQAGSGMHCHIQLWEDGKNLFGSDEGTELSRTGQMFIAGLLKHAPAITAIANPTINSYKRLVPHNEAPVFISWGPMNRTALIRVPLFTEPRKAAIEFRSPDAMANPYLLFTAIIAAGMDGIDKELSPPRPIKSDVFRLTDDERATLGIQMLPSNLGEALKCLQQDKVIVEHLGKAIVDTFVSIKQREWDQYLKSAVTGWEWEQYQDL